MSPLMSYAIVAISQLPKRGKLLLSDENLIY